jgi:dipeptidyl aminopeptidase/acylaminoacyl peptidase
MKKILLLSCAILLAAVITETLYIFDRSFFGTEIKTEKPQEKPLLTYSFENLKNTKFPIGNITLGRVVSETTDSFSQMFYFSVPEKPNSKVMLKVSGLMNIPKTAGSYPVIVMFRGFVPDNIYKPGIGTQPSATVFVNHGFITLAPDFLGFGESASPSADPFENRFQAYTTALALLSALPSLNGGLKPNYVGTISADLNKIGIWGHSNGGHIALSALAISGVNYPTVLWAPVSTSFPYSILYYTDESDDQGKALRQTLSGFENIYNTDLFSPTNYYGWIKAPIEINQGTADQEVPVWWSDNLVATLKKDNVSVKYITYPGADHNLLPTGWSDAVLNSIDYFNQQFKQE